MALVVGSGAFVPFVSTSFRAYCGRNVFWVRKHIDSINIVYYIWMYMCLLRLYQLYSTIDCNCTHLGCRHIRHIQIFYRTHKPTESDRERSKHPTLSQIVIFPLFILRHHHSFSQWLRQQRHGNYFGKCFFWCISGAQHFGTNGRF